MRHASSGHPGAAGPGPGRRRGELRGAGAAAGGGGRPCGRLPEAVCSGWRWLKGVILMENHRKTIGKPQENGSLMGFNGISWDFRVIQWDIHGIYPLVRKMAQYGFGPENGVYSQ